MAEAVVSIVVGRLTDLLTEEAQHLHNVRAEIEELVTKLMWMKTFLRDADSRKNDFEILNLVADIGEQAYDAEHVVESFFLKASFSKLNRRNHANKYIAKIKDITRKLSLLSDRFHDFNIKSTSDTPEMSNSSSIKAGKLKRFYSYTTVEPEMFVGFQEDLDCLVGHLVDESDDCYPLISICGMGGLGKTTLAQKIYNHSTIKTYFAGLAWVSISQKWQTELVLQRILICLVPNKKDDILAMDKDKLVKNLKKIQRRKKCLIVLDDIWSTDAWDSLKDALTPKKSLSKLLLTSRKVEVARHVNPEGFIHQPQCLSAEQSWELLMLKALPRGDHLDITRDIKKMEELGRKMVGNCSGLPLAIVILGGILVTKPSLIEWEKVYNDSLLSLNRGKGLGEDYQRELFDVLVWSYNDLPPQLKPCFLYIGKFSEDEWIKTHTIYQLWIAEGIVLSSDKREGETMMQVAESYIGELVHKGLVQVRSNEVDILRQLLWDHNFNLQELQISGPIPELAQLLEQQICDSRADVSLIRITRLRLESSFLEEDPMPVLEKIPKLRKLYLMNFSFMGKEMVCSAVGFLKLTFLHLFNLPNLKKWKLQKGSMPFLSELVISECPQLEELPEGLRFLASLQTLDLHLMPSAFCDRVRVISGEQGADFYKVAHVPMHILNN